MVTTQVELTEKQAQALDQIATVEGVTTSDLIRQAVDGIIRQHERREKWQRSLEVIGRYDSGLTDVSKNHDKYLAEDLM